MQIKRAVATGFATVDFVVEVSEQFSGTGTREIKHSPTCDWPRAGGAALYTCRQMAKAGIGASPVTWVGFDRNAALYQEACQKSAVDTDGVAVVQGSTTPTCILIYQPDGNYGCLFDSGGSHPEELTIQQRSLFQTADLVILAVGPPALAEEILSHIRPDAIVAWIAKLDYTGYPEHVRHLYSARADYIFCNHGERAFVEDSFSTPRTENQVIIETRGSQSVLIDTYEQRIIVPVSPKETPDATGAGDTLAGVTMAQVLTGQVDLKLAVEEGIRQTAAFLKERL